MKTALDIVIAIDTREQRPWTFGDLPTVTKTLATADYSVCGFEDVIGLERKSLPDLISSLTFGRDRFERELDRLEKFRRKAIVVEGDLASIVAWDYRSSVAPQCIVGSLGSFFGRWDIPTIFAGNARNGEILARSFLTKAAKWLGAAERAA